MHELHSVTDMSEERENSCTWKIRRRRDLLLPAFLFPSDNNNLWQLKPATFFDQVNSQHDSGKARNVSNKRHLSLSAAHGSCPQGHLPFPTFPPFAKV